MVNEDYLACSAYEGQAMHGTEPNFSAFFVEEGHQYFFALLDSDGKVLLKSEGYPQPAARDNGLQSVIKNRVNRDFYSVKEDDGTYYLSLRAGNYREIARSCNVATEAEALALIAHVTGEQVGTSVVAAPEAETVVEAAAPEVTVEAAAATAVASIAAVETIETETVTEAAPIVHEAVVETTAHVEAAAPAVDVEDDYLPCRDYHGHTTSPRDGFRTFFSEHSNKYYFAVVDAEGDVTLRSEGHLTAEERDADMADVVQNIFKKERYNIKKVGFHHHFIVLRNAHGKEIARSCAHDSLASIHDVAPFLNPEKPATKVEVVATALAPVVGTFTSTNEPASAETIKISTSETIKEAPLATVVGTVATSIAATSIASAPVIIRTVQTVETIAAVPPPPPPPPPVVEKPVDVEDDYLPCREYEGRPISDKSTNVTMFKHTNGQFYFAIYNADETVRLRSEGFRTSQDRDKELSGALKNLNNPDMYTTVRRGDYYMSILKDKTGREVGRSCLHKDEPTPIVAPIVAPVVEPEIAVAAVAAAAAFVPEMKIEEPVHIPVPEVTVAPPVYVAPVVEEEVIAETGFKWWWLLLPLLALLAWWAFGRGCNPPPPPPPPVPVEVPKTIEATPATEPQAAAPSCDLNWILFDFDKSDITAAAKAELAQMAKILKDNKDYLGVLSAHTDAKGSDTYNDALSLRRAEAAKSTLVAMGIEAERLSTKADGKGSPVAQNTSDDEGRRFNRRVELYIQDKTGKNICQSIAPNIPDALKTK